jgi:ABC-type multidrug transport system ATPase subunit
VSIRDERPGRDLRLDGVNRIRVGEAVHLFSALARTSVDEARLLGEWGLAGKAGTSYGSLSGGQRQRLHVALALVTRPRLVVLDEMTTGLDPNARREVWELVSFAVSAQLTTTCPPTSRLWWRPLV